MDSIALAPARGEADPAHPFAFRYTAADGCRVAESYPDRDAAVGREEELGAAGIVVEWLRCDLSGYLDDLTALWEDPPRAADIDWWKGQAPDRDYSEVEAEADRFAWLDRFHDLDWSLYPGPGAWDSDGGRCMPLDGKYVKWERVRFCDYPDAGPSDRGIGTVAEIHTSTEGFTSYHVRCRMFDDGTYRESALWYGAAELSPVVGPPEGSTR